MFLLKFATAAFITAINISVYCIWVPSKLQISQRYHDINIWWDRTEKVLYLLTDGTLNFIFIRTVQERLISVGLTKYDKLVRFNKYIIFVSLSMDVLIIAMMSYKNDFIYMQFHSVAYIVKLEIEMQMSKLIVKVARGTGVNIMDDDPTSSSSRTANRRGRGGSRHRVGHADTSVTNPAISVRVSTEVVTRQDKDNEHELEMWNVKMDPDDSSNMDPPPKIKTDDGGTPNISRSPSPPYLGRPQMVHFGANNYQDPV